MLKPTARNVKFMKSSVNFSRLWERLSQEAERSGNTRLKSVLLNHERKKEYICRKLGVVTESDVNRIVSEVKM